MVPNMLTIIEMVPIMLATETYLGDTNKEMTIPDPLPTKNPIQYKEFITLASEI